MKIRFGANQIVDTNLLGEQNVATMMESTEEADILNDSINDGTSSYEDQTQLNLLKRFVKGFLNALADGSARHEWEANFGYTFDKIYEEFDDVVSSRSEGPDWGGVADAIQYDDAQEQEGA